MKNLLVYISPDKKFIHEYELMLEAQIDNSSDYWRLEDTILLTNFPYEYHGVKALVGPDSLINKAYSTQNRGIINSKVNGIIYLLENKIINELTWFHDFDSFQLVPLDLPHIRGDVGVLTYGIYPESRLIPLAGSYKYRINFGNVFFTPKALDIFKMLLVRMDRDELYEEDAMTLLLAENYLNIAPRVQIMNQTYGIGRRCIPNNIAIADKPIRVAHFPAYYPQVLSEFKEVLPPKLFKMLGDRFVNHEIIDDLKKLDHRKLWKPFLKKYGCKVICEIGVREGKNLKLMTEHNPKIAVAVDSWINDKIKSRNDLGYSQKELDRQYESVKKMATSKPCIQIYREYSFEAAKRFPNEYFDLVYVDADHTYEGCLEDLVCWYPKVKKGRFLLGDDYVDAQVDVTGVKFEVIKAVNRFAKMHNLEVYQLPRYGWAIIK